MFATSLLIMIFNRLVFASAIIPWDHQLFKLGSRHFLKSRGHVAKKRAQMAGGVGDETDE
jgi:hypothetical protein